MWRTVAHLNLVGVRRRGRRTLGCLVGSAPLPTQELEVAVIAGPCHFTVRIGRAPPSSSSSSRHSSGVGWSARRLETPAASSFRLVDRRR